MIRDCKSSRHKPHIKMQQSLSTNPTYKLLSVTSQEHRQQPVNHFLLREYMALPFLLCSFLLTPESTQKTGKTVHVLSTNFQSTDYGMCLPITLSRCNSYGQVTNVVFQK